MTAYSAPGAAAPGVPELTAVRDIPYASASPTQKLDLYLPSGEGPWPVVVFLHGGGFVFGTKAEPTVDAIRGTLLASGYALASVDYRLTGEAQFPAQLQDVKAAIRWLRANASRFRLQPDAVAVWGTSAGGYLAALAGTSCGVPALEGGDLGHADQSSCVQAVVDWFGPSDLLRVDSDKVAASCPVPDQDPHLTWLALYLGGPASAHEALARSANPTAYITPDDPPTLIEQGTDDCVVPLAQSQLLYESLRHKTSSRITLKVLDGAGHYGPAFTSPANLRFVLDFLDASLK
jgi:acetyl esterase/lipase